MVKNCDLDLENAALGLRPRAAFQDLGHSFSPYGPTLSQQITSRNFENAIVFKVKIVKMPKVEIAPYNRVFRRNFRLNNLNETSSKIQGASYNRLCLLTEKIRYL